MTISHKTLWVGIAIILLAIAVACANHRHQQNQANVQMSADALVLITAHSHRDDLTSDDDRYNPAALRLTSKNKVAEINTMSGHSDTWTGATLDPQTNMLHVSLSGRRSLLPIGILPLTYRVESEVALTEYSACELIFYEKRGAQCQPSDSCELITTRDGQTECRELHFTPYK